MKRFKQLMALLLCAALMLSCVYLGPVAASAAAIDTYIASCTAYAANLSVKTTQATTLMTWPASAQANSSSSSSYNLPANTMLTVKALYKNTAGEYWYEVLYYDMTLYAKAADTTMVSHLTGDVTISNVMSPASLAYGNSFGIKGDISSTLNDLGTISASMHPNTNITKAPSLIATDTANSKSYSLANSTIDSNLTFGSMDPGVYTYVVTAEAVSYYIDDSDALATSAQTVVLETQECVITDWTNPNDDLAFGIDVSTWQDSIDWSQVKNDVDFAILRIGFAETLDNRFLEYAAGCEQYGIPYGVYLYSYTLTADGAVAEAQFVIDTLRSYNYYPQLGVWYDMEDSTQAALSTSLLETICTNFCDTIAAAGYQPGFYGFTSWFSTSYQNGYLSSIPVWIAQIDGFSSNGTATHDGGTWLWQYSWEGSISGISGDVDCNLCYADFSVFNSDTSYLSKCTYYPAHSIGKTTTSVTLRQYPSTSYTSLGTVSSGTELEITGVYKNASSEYWYQVNNNGTVGYIHSDYVTVSQFLYDDLAAIGPAMASNISLGSSYSLSGNIVSQYNTIYNACAKIYSGEDTLADPVLSSSYTTSSKEYNLNGSEVDYGLAFNALDTGYYTYEISADVKNYYISSGSLTSKTENVVVWTAPFTVGSASIEPDTVICNHTTVTDAAVAATCTTSGLTAGSHCSKCGTVFTAQTVIPATGHNYVCSVTEPNCQEYAKFTYTCSSCGDSYTTSATEWQDTKPAGVDESMIESKTQYRYSDYETKTSYETSLSGYTLKSSAWEQSGTGSVKYVPSWPSGFSTSSSLYTTYNKASSKKTASETTTAKTVINSDDVVGYLYYHWCYTDSYYSSESKSGSYTTFHAYYDTTDPSNYTCDTSDMSYKTSHSSCSNTNWWFVTEVYEQKYTTYKKLFTYERWTDWSDWSETAVTASDTRKVETRTLYRYADTDLGDHNYVGGVCTICGAFDTAYVTDYYLFGWINGSDYACEGDAANMGEYKFVDGTLTVTFEEDSYVGIKTNNNIIWYMTDGWQGYVNSVTLYDRDSLSNVDQLFVPGGVEVTFTLVVNSDGSLTLSYEADEPEAPTVTLNFPTLSFEDEIFYNVAFTVNNPDNVEITEMGLLTWSSAIDGTIDTAEAVIPGATTYNTYLMARSEGIPAKKMGETMYFKVYLKLADGSYVYSVLRYYSAKTYALGKINGTADADIKALCVALLNYGAAAQTYFGYDTGNLMNASLTTAQQALVDDYSSSMVASVVNPSPSKITGLTAVDGGYTSKYPAINFEGAFAITYNFKPAHTVDGDMKLYVWNAATYSSASKLTTSNASQVITMTADGDGMYSGDVTGIAAKDVDSTIYVCGIYESNGVTYRTGVLAYSLGAYCSAQAAGSTATQPLAAATAVYAYYAKTYLTSL